MPGQENAWGFKDLKMKLKKESWQALKGRFFSKINILWLKKKNSY